MPEELLSLLFSQLDPIYEVHCGLLKEIEHRMATWWVMYLWWEPKARFAVKPLYMQIGKERDSNTVLGEKRREKGG
jgi:hypothetical protein